MRSTGEVMGIDSTFGRAFYKAELAAGTVLPMSGTVFLSLADPDIETWRTRIERAIGTLTAEVDQLAGGGRS